MNGNPLKEQNHLQIKGRRSYNRILFSGISEDNKF